MAAKIYTYHHHPDCPCLSDVGLCYDVDYGATDRDGNACDYYDDHPDDCGTLNDCPVISDQDDAFFGYSCDGLINSGVGNCAGQDCTCEYLEATGRDCTGCVCQSYLGEGCLDTDNGATDSAEMSCSVYTLPACGTRDDDDFDAWSMCCACGGGTQSRRRTQSSGTNLLYSAM